MENRTCLVLGDINLDFNLHSENYPPEGGRTHAGQAHFRLGGSGCQTAVALNKLGCPTALAGNLGGDMLGDWCARQIEAAGVDGRFVRCLPDEQTGFFMVVKTPGGQQTTFGSRGANALPLPENALLKDLQSFRHLHISGYTLHGEKQYEVVRRILINARQAGLTTSLDPGICSSQQAREEILTLLIHIDYFLPSLEELALLVGRLPLDEQLEFVLDQGCGAIVLKMGERGSRYIDANLAVHQPAVQEAGKQILNTNGAGDCFNAGFLKTRLEGASPKAALQAGNAAAFRLITNMYGIFE